MFIGIAGKLISYTSCLGSSVLSGQQDMWSYGLLLESLQIFIN